MAGVQLTAYDVALKDSACCFVLEWDGRLPQEALQDALDRVLQEYPELAGQAARDASKAGSYVIRTPPGTPTHTACSFAYQQRPVRPQLRTLLDLWRAGAMPSMLQQQLSAAAVTYYRDCDRTLLVAVYDHLLTDVNGFQTILNRWMELTAAICRGEALPEPPAAPAAAGDRLAFFSRPCQLQTAGDGAADSGSIPAVQHWPPTEVPEGGAAAAAATPGSNSVAEACRQWLAAHRPTFGDPLDDVGRCKAAWGMLGNALTAHFVVGLIPRDQLESIKAAAAAARPLPAGQYYSSAVATAALMAATLYFTDPAKYNRQGGLYVHFVVDARRGRCGMAIPPNSICNASIWGARVWVSSSMLAAAQGQATPDLMHLLKTQLAKNLRDPQGELNQQFAYWEALRGAGLCGKAHVMAHLRQLEGDVAVDYLPDVAAQLPSVPGTRLRYSVFRWAYVSVPCTFLSWPTLPQECCGSIRSSNSLSISGSFSSCSSSGSRPKEDCTCGSCGVRFEVCLPGRVAAKAQALWQAAGVRLVTDPADDVLGAGGTMWSVMEMLVLAGSIPKAARDLFMPLPLLLLHLIGVAVMLLVRLLRRLLFGNIKQA